MRSILLTRLMLVLSILFSSSLTAQIWLDDSAIYDEAEEYIQGEEYEEALPLYLLLEKKGKINSNISYKIGKCYLNIEGKKNKAIPYLEAAIENVSNEYESKFTEVNAPVESHMLLGIVYRINEKFVEAIAEFGKYKSLKQDSNSETLADYHISMCRTAKTMMSFPNQSKLEVVNIEGSNPVYNPLVTQSGNSYYMEKRPFYDAIIKAEYENGAVFNAQNISPQIKSDGNHIFINANQEGNVIILRAYDAEYGYELYFATLNEQGKWSNYEKFPEPINSPQNEIFATYTADMKTLFFCSNRSGGFGGADIYSSEIDENGNWSDPKNLGALVNSPFDESTVFVSFDGDKLFFSSEGHLSMGGNDYFMASKNKEGIWGRPVNLGSPVSTPDEDMFLSPTQVGNVFYTHRFDTKQNDRQKLYRLTLDESALERKVILNGQLEFNEEIPAKEVSFKIKEGESVFYASKTDAEGAFSSLLPAGTYNIEYQYNEEISGSQKVDIGSDFSIDELNLEAPAWITTIPDVQEEVFVTIKPILFEFNSYKILSSYYSYLDSVYSILKKHENVNINIVGHTDAIGNYDYNQKLSVKRALEVKNYFIKKGLNSSRSFVKGMGEKEPVAINTNPDGSDNKLGRKYNRRVRINLIMPDSSFFIKFIDEVPEDLKVK